MQEEINGHHNEFDKRDRFIFGVNAYCCVFIANYSKTIRFTKLLKELAVECEILFVIGCLIGLRLLNVNFTATSINLYGYSREHHF